MTTDDALLLREILLEVRALRADVELLATRGRLSRGERQVLEALLPAAAAIVGDSVFVASDLVEFPSLRALLDGYSASSAAWLFAKANGSRIAGVRVERVGRDRSGALWMLRLEREVAARPRAIVR